MQRTRILIVQSDADLAEALREGLAPSYRVEVAAEPARALTSLERFRPDVLLLDLSLPGGSAVQLLEYLSGLGVEAPPVVVTGARGRDSSLEPFQDLVAAVLPKPFHLDQLLRQLEEVLTSWHPTASRRSVSSGLSVLLVTGDTGQRATLPAELVEAGVQVTEAASCDEGIAIMAMKRFDAVVTDWVLPGGTGRTVLDRSRSLPSPPPIIVLSANTTPHFAIRTLALGVADVLPKPVSGYLLVIALEKVRLRVPATAQAAAARMPAGVPTPGAPTPGAPTPTAPPPAPPVDFRRPYAPAGKSAIRYSPEDIIGLSPAMQRARIALQQVARMNSTVLLSGDTGTGKELFAQALHGLSGRRTGPFVAVNAAAIPESLLESELFGYSSGAFTGARREGHRGKFAMAHGGTLFLDEIGDLSLNLQSKLLRVLQEGEIDPVGGQGPQRVDVRLVAATHRDLAQMVRQGTFRSDLYFRLNVVNIPIPALRERVEDVPLLAERFLAELCERYQMPPKRFDHECLDILSSYSWPGNVRELRNAVEQAFVFSAGELIVATNLPADMLNPAAAPAALREAESSLALAERESIQRALEQTRGNKARAARLLGISRAGLYVKLKVYGLG